MFIKETEKGVILKVRVQPNAGRDRIAGLYGEAIKICVSSPPVDGAANIGCIRYLAKILSISKSKIEIISGERSRNKILLVKGIQVDDLSARIRKVES